MPLQSFSHSAVCLQAYLDSGQAALMHLQTGLVDDAIAALRKRKASFHNFRVADYNDDISGSYESGGQGEALRQLWLDIATQDAALEQALRDALGELSGQLRRIKSAKRRLGSFKSTHHAPAQFSKKV